MNCSYGIVSPLSVVLPRPCSALGAGHHGVGEAGQRVGDLPPGRDALSASLLPGQGRRSGIHADKITTAQWKHADYPLLHPADDLPYIKCPLHTVLKLTPVAYGRSKTSQPNRLSLRTFYFNVSSCSFVFQAAKWKCFT